MNDDLSAAADTARLPTRDDSDSDTAAHHYHHADAEADADPGESTSGRRVDGRRPRRSSQNRRRRRSSSRLRRARAGIARKLEFTTNLMSSLDVLVFAELSVLYYMEYVLWFPPPPTLYTRLSLVFRYSDNPFFASCCSCSFARLVMRSLVQYMYLTPKPEEFLKIMPAPRPQMYTIFFSNILCMLLHLLFSLPEASETMRGYLHGGVIIDFIGQKAPASKLSLVLLDGVVMALQCVMCAVWLEKDRIKKIEVTLKSVAAGGFPKGRTGSAMRSVPAAALDLETGVITSRQDLDAEERGVLRDDPLGGADETNSIEMRPLINERDAPGNNGGNGGRSAIEEARYQRYLRALGGSQSDEGPDRPSLVDVLMSGNGLLANFHVVHSIRTLIAHNVSDPVPVAGYPLQLTGYTTTLARLAAERQRRASQRS